MSNATVSTVPSPDGECSRKSCYTSTRIYTTIISLSDFHLVDLTASTGNNRAELNDVIRDLLGKKTTTLGSWNVSSEPCLLPSRTTKLRYSKPIIMKIVDQELPSNITTIYAPRFQASGPVTQKQQGFLRSLKKP
jgi:hypothetical protein